MACPRPPSAVAALLSLAALSTSVVGQQQQPADRFALTIYSSADPATFDPKQLAQQRLANPYNAWQLKLPGYGVVREVRPINLAAGENTLRFTDVAAGIDPTTVGFESLTAPASVLEQSYEYDVVSADKLVEKFVGEPVTLTRSVGDGDEEEITGKLLSAEPGSVVIQPEGQPVRVLSRGQIVSIQLANVANLITKPTLVWKLRTEQPGPHTAKVTYQTDGLTWRADYSLVVNKDDTAADLGAWVSILNESGASYPEAKLKLVAGDVQRVQPPQQPYGNMAYAAREMRDEADASFQQKSFFEYHLYTLGRPTSLPDNSTKQIELFPTKRGVPLNKTYVYYGLPEQYRTYFAPEPNQDRDLGSQTNKKVDVYLQFKNDEPSGLGVPLPAGRVRVYKRDDADAANEFVGEDVIQHTPKDEEVLVKLGIAFDVVGERKQTDFQVNLNGHVIIESFEIKLRNHKPERVDVIVKENLYRWTNWEITQTSDKWEKQDHRTIHLPLQVPADGEKVVRYTVKYTW